MLDIQSIVSYVYSRKYNCSNDLIKIITFYKYLKTPKELSSTIMQANGFPLNQFPKLKKNYENCQGDGFALIKIADDLINFISSISPNYNLQNTVEKEIIQQKQLYLKHVQDKDFRNIPKDILNKMISLYNTNRLSSDETLSIKEKDEMNLSNLYLNIRLSVFESEDTNIKIKKWCEERYLNYDTVSIFFKNYLKIKNKISQNEDKFLWFDSHLPIFNTQQITNTYYPVQLSLLHGYSYNLVRNISIVTHQPSKNMEFFNISCF